MAIPVLGMGESTVAAFQEVARRVSRLQDGRQLGAVLGELNALCYPIPGLVPEDCMRLLHKCSALTVTAPTTNSGAFAVLVTNIVHVQQVRNKLVRCQPGCRVHSTS